MDKRFSSEPLYYYMLDSGLDGYAPRNEVVRMKGVVSSRQASLDEAESYFSLVTLNPHLAVA